MDSVQLTSDMPPQSTHDQRIALMAKVTVIAFAMSAMVAQLTPTLHTYFVADHFAWPPSAKQIQRSNHISLSTGPGGFMSPSGGLALLRL
jgi:hypothetical protein